MSTEKNAFAIAQNLLLNPFDLDTAKVQKILAQMMSRSLDYADFYFQFTRSEGWSLEEGIVKSGSYQIDQGVGIRAVSGEKTAFAYSDEISENALRNASQIANTMSAKGIAASHQVKPNKARLLSLYEAYDPIPEFSAQAKVDLLKRVEELAKAKDPRVVQVMADLSAEYDVVLVARNDGVMAADVRPLVRLSVTVIAQQGDRRESGFAGGGGRYNYHYFSEEKIEHYVAEAVNSALINLEAKPAPAGEMTVVLGPGWPGVLLHEAIGHGLEGDFNRKGSSAFGDRIGQRIASKGVTVVDDGTLPNRRGSLNIDDEGNPTQCTTLIEDGILKGYLQDSLNARLMKMPLTGNARRESYSSLPMPRMTNTYMLNGSMNPSEIIANVKQGLYALNFSGGQVDITNGKFVFSASEAYRIENGKITTPVKGATLIGNGPDVLTRITHIGNDMQLDSGIGVCGKEGQSVPVGVGQPTLCIAQMTVGGTQR